MTALALATAASAIGGASAAAHDRATAKGAAAQASDGESTYSSRWFRDIAPPMVGRGLQPAPLEGVGKDMEIVANLPIPPEPGAAAANQASDIELHGDYAFVGSYTQGMVIVDISNPTQPVQVGKFFCPGGQNDIQLSPDGKIAAMAIESRSNLCHPGDEGSVVIDVSDPTNPRELSFINRAMGVTEGSHNHTLDWPYLYIDQYINTYSKTQVFDLSNPSAPKEVGSLGFNGDSSFHDSIPDHRPDGKHLLYAASITASDVLDIKDPSKPKLLQRIRDPQVGISHGAEPNFDRSLLIVTDEYGGGSGVGACGGRPGDTQNPPGAPGGATDPASLGAVHFYRLTPEGTVLNNGVATGKAGIFNIDYQANDQSQIAEESGCTAHVFWQAPDQNRLTIAWYGRGTRVVDFSDPLNPKELGYFIPKGAETWAAKPHRGYIYASDTKRGLDVLRYTGEQGQAWPSTSGPAEVQRAQVQGATLPGATPGPGGQPSGQAPGTTTGPAGTKGRGAQARRLVLSRRAVRVKRGRVSVGAYCQSASPCRGTLTLRLKQRGRKAVTLGRGSFSIRANAKGVVRVRLSRRGRRLVSRMRRSRVQAIAALRAEGAGQKAVTTRGSLRLSGRRRGR